MHEREVIIKTADGDMDCFVTHPEEGGPFPVVILYMDAPGIREELRDMARRIGTVGYFVMLPNMYYRTGREGGYGFDLARTREDEGELKKMFAVMNTLTNALVVADTGPMLEFAHGADGLQGHWVKTAHGYISRAEGAAADTTIEVSASVDVATTRC